MKPNKTGPPNMTSKSSTVDDVNKSFLKMANCNQIIKLVNQPTKIKESKKTQNEARQNRPSKYDFQIIKS